MVNLILSAILTPTSDLFNLLLMAGPLIILYEVGILSARLFGRPPAPPAEEMDEPVKVPEGTAGRRILFFVVLVAGLASGGALAQLSPGGVLDELGPESFVSIQSLALGEGQTVYAGSFGRGVFKSEDGGKSWTAVNEGTTGRGMSRSRAGCAPSTRSAAARLSQPGDQLPANFVRSLVVDKTGTRYAGTADNGVYVSTDRGDTWRIIGGQLANASVRGIAIGEPSWFVGTGIGMYRSSDQGKTWMQVNNGLTERAIQSFAVGKDGTVYAGTSGGVLKTEDHGAHWVSTNQGIATSRNPAPRH